MMSELKNHPDFDEMNEVTIIYSFIKNLKKCIFLVLREELGSEVQQGVSWNLPPSLRSADQEVRGRVEPPQRNERKKPREDREVRPVCYKRKR